jgi:DNA-binding NarL/FixJ family response regulator
MIDVVVAEDHELFRLGLTGILAATDEFRIVAQPQTPEQLLSILKRSKPHLLLLSTSFLHVFSDVERVLLKRQIALLVVAEQDDRIAYTRWLRARAIIRRSMDGPAVVDAMRRVARGELFIQDRSSDNKEKRVLYICYDPDVLVARELLLQQMGYRVCTVLGHDGLMARDDIYLFDFAVIGDEGSEADQCRAAHVLHDAEPRPSIIALCRDARDVAGTDYCVSSRDADAWPE